MVVLNKLWVEWPEVPFNDLPFDRMPDSRYFRQALSKSICNGEVFRVRMETAESHGMSFYIEITAAMPFEYENSTVRLRSVFNYRDRVITHFIIDSEVSHGTA